MFLKLEKFNSIHIPFLNLHFLKNSIASLIDESKVKKEKQENKPANYMTPDIDSFIMQQEETPEKTLEIVEIYPETSLKILILK